MDIGWRYLRWLAYVAVIAVFMLVFFATVGKAAVLIYQHI